MRDFMQLVCDILPCKYCRASFTKYSNSLDITPFLDNRETIQEWLYKMHNKVNGKLRRQGFCTIENPSFEAVKEKYIKKTMEPLHAFFHQVRNKKLSPRDAMEKMIDFICCDIGYDFLGSIVFNYQGYFANCHTGDEKTKIISNYHKFFNMIPILLAQYIGKLNPDGKKILDTYEISKPRIRNMLSQNEPYSKLIRWFYSSYPKFNDIGEYENYFVKHIVATCNNPIADKVKSCRKLTKKENTRCSRIHHIRHKTKHKTI